MIRLLFVCTGNICRSPTAEGVARVFAGRMGMDIEVQSAGMSAYHVGEAPDDRSAAVALSRGYDLSQQRSQKIEPEDFERFDYIIAMDKGHKEQLLNMPVSGQARAKLSLMMDWAKGPKGLDVPDPYYDDDGFETVLTMIEESVTGLLEQV